MDAHPCSMRAILENQNRIVDVLSAIELHLRKSAEGKAPTLSANRTKTEPQRLLTVKEAAAEMRLRDSTVRLWIARRRIASVRLGRRVFVPAEEIDGAINDGLVPKMGRP